MPISPTKSKTENLLKQLLAEGGVEPSVELISCLGIYLDELRVWNSRLNLTGLKSVEEMALKHVGDTLTLLPVIPEGTRAVLDIGTGAGVPGLILKIIRRDLEIVLVDAIRKRVSFLKSVMAELGLKAVWAEQGLVGTRGVPRHRPSQGFDCVVSQAVGPLVEFANMADALLARGGVAISMKGPGGAMELDSGRDELNRKGWKAEIVSCRLPVSGEMRNLILLRKAAA